MNVKTLKKSMLGSLINFLRNDGIYSSCNLFLKINNIEFSQTRKVKVKMHYECHVRKYTRHVRSSRTMSEEGV